MAYGGAGRDVLIANTNGDRLIDWVGEFNTMLTPYAQFGVASVSRLLQPALPDYLLALSKSEGADQTLAAEHGSDPARNGEPFGELGMVLQQDAAWQAQTGAPRDPQGGNLPGGKVDVRTSAGTQPIWQSAAGPDTVTSDAESQWSINEATLAPIVEEAKLRWSEALGAGDSHLAVLNSVTVQIGNLPQDRLGVTLGYDVYIDGRAAGRGWYVDLAPQDNAEFALHASASTLMASNGSAAFNRMDLLTTVMHEMGNAMGFQETSGHGVMSDTLSPSERFLLDHLGLDGNPDRPISDATLMQLAKRAVELNFDLGTNGAGAGGSVDWHAAADVNWDPSYSPFKSGKDVKGAAQNFTDYLVKIAPSKEFDALGKALNGSKKAAR